MIMCLLSTWLLGICSGTRSSWDSSPPARCKNQSPCHLSSLSFPTSLSLNISFPNDFFSLPLTHLAFVSELFAKKIDCPASFVSVRRACPSFFRWKILHICKIWLANIERFFDKCINQRVFSSISFLPGSTIPLKRPLSKRHPLKMPI